MASQAEGTQHDGTQPDSIDLLDDLDEDQQLQQAIRQSLLPHGADMQPTQQQKPTMYDQDLERALAESMRTFEAEQQGSGGTAGRKRSSSDEHMTGDPQHQQPDHTALVPGPELQQQQQQQQPAGGALKRPRSISIPGNAGLSIPEQHPQQHQGSTMASQGQQRNRLSRLHAGVVITTSLQAQPPPQQRQRLQGVLALTGGVQRSASVTNTAAGRLPPFPSCGILQPATAQEQQQPHHHQQQQQQQPLGSGLGRSASAEDLQDDVPAAGSDGGSMEPAGSRPSSPQAAARQRRLAVEVQEPNADEEEDLYMDVPNSDDSMSSGIPTTHWAPGVLQAAVAVLPAAAPQAPRRIGPGPVVGDEGEWCIHDRLLYEGQPIYWQAYRNGASYPGRVLTVEGGGAGSPVLYTAEIHQHPAGLRYVEASAGQLHPQLRVGDMVWCKPAAAKKACWSGHGPLFLQLHPLHPLGLLQPQTCEEAPWRMGVVLQVQLWHGQNPIAELRILGTGGYDTCWFRAAQLELVREIGESSAAAAKRAGTLSGLQVAQQVQEVEMDLLAGLEQEQQSQAQPSSLQQQQQQLQRQAGVDDVLLAADEQQQGVDQGGGALPPTTQQAVAAVQQAAGEAADGTPPPSGTAIGASASPQPAAAPSLLSHRAATLTGESGLEAAAAPAATVEQGADAANAAQQQQQQAPAAGSAQGGKGTSQQQQQHVVLEGTGESAEALMVEEVVGDSCGGPSGGCQAGDQGAIQEGEAEGAAPSPPQPLSNQLSGVEDSSPRPGQEGYGET